MSTKLFYISTDNDDGEDLSAVVEATDPLDAIQQWRNWLREFGEEDLGDEEWPDRKIFELPEKTGVSKHFNWHVPGGVIEHEL